MRLGIIFNYKAPKKQKCRDRECKWSREGGTETMTETVIQLNFAPNLVNAR